jgi:Protein of unknown function (DUF3108)
MKIFILALALSVSSLTQAAVVLPQTSVSAYQPKAYTASYSVTRNGKELGIATVKFNALTNGRWEMTSHTVGTGIAAIAGVEIHEYSTLRWVNGKPETIDYSFKQKAGWKNKERSIKVNAQNKKVDSQDNDKSFSFAYQPSVLDRHAVTVAIIQDLAQGKRGDLLYSVADRDELQNQRYRVMNEEKIDTGLGLQTGTKVQRIRETPNGKTTTLWLGKEKQFVPLRIEQTESNGDKIEMRITKLI